jgi:hypothetical protein
MKILTIITLVMIMMAASVIPALAAGGPPTDHITKAGNGSAIRLVLESAHRIHCQSPSQQLILVQELSRKPSLMATGW